MASISRSSWNVSGAHLRVTRGKRPSERTVPVEILPRTLQQRSIEAEIVEAKIVEAEIVRPRHVLGYFGIRRDRVCGSIPRRAGSAVPGCTRALLSWQSSLFQHGYALGRNQKIARGRRARATLVTLGPWLRLAPPALPIASCRGRLSLSRCLRRGACS
jgi:hypothetical protein